VNLLQNARISTKILSLLLMLGALTFGLAYQGSSRLRTTDDSYSDLTDIKLPNSTRLARANRRVTEMAYASYRTIALDGASAEAKAASSDEADAYQDAIKLLSDVKANEPDAATEVDKLSLKISNAHATMQQAISEGLLNRNEQATAIMKGVDKAVDAIGDEMKAYNDARIAASKKLSDELSASTVATSWTMLTSSIVGILIAVGVSAWVVFHSITRPINQLSSTMGALARGDHHIDIPGTKRGDELGGMAKAVLVFRDAAVAKDEADAAKARADAEQQMVVATLSQGLQSLSEGDLTGGISAEFPQNYAGVKTTFNKALRRLQLHSPRSTGA
jgi:methyl-accepting chemotaxis protein